MIAVKNSHGFPTFISGSEGRVYRKIQHNGFCAINKLTEQERYTADQLFQRGLLRKASRKEEPGYETYSQSTTLKG